MLDNKKFLTKLRGLWFDSIANGSEVLHMYKGLQKRMKVVAKDPRHKMLYLNPGDDQLFWAGIGNCKPIPEYMNTDIYKALIGENEE